MKVTSVYDCTNEDNNYIKFICELDKNTLLKLSIIDKDTCEIIMADKISGIVDISSKVSNDDIKALIRTLRNISVEMDKLSVERG